MSKASEEKTKGFVAEKLKNIHVKFAAGEKTFIFPDAFARGFLELQF